MDTMHVIGIDVGLGGAVAILPEQRIYDTPVVTPTKGGRQYLPAQMADLIRPWAGAKTTAVLEKQQAFPQQGRSSVFSIGTGYGIWLGILGTLKIPVTIVAPAVWKKEMFGSMGELSLDKKKEAARVRASELYPGMSHLLQRVMDHDRAEALLLARYGVRVVK